MRLIIVLLFALVSCEPPEGTMSDLFQGIEPSAIGRSPLPIASKGNSSVIVGPGGRGNLIQLLNFTGNGDVPESITGVIYVQPTPATVGGVVPNQGGPITARIAWGSGLGTRAFAEFDVPMGFANPVNQHEAPQNGVVFSVVGTSLDIGVRNDAGVIPRTGDSQLGVEPSVVNASAFIGSGRRMDSQSPLYLSDWLIRRVGAGGLAPAATVNSEIPAFARRVRIARGTTCESISVHFTDQGGQIMDGPYIVAANVPSPVFDIQPSAGQLVVTNLSGALSINEVVAVYYISL